MTPRLFFLTLIAILALSPAVGLGRSEGSIQKTWDYPEGIQNLVIETDRHDVVLRAGGPRLTGRLVGDNNDVLKLTRSGDTLTITARTDRSWLSWRPKSASLEVSLPPGLNLNVTTASGGVLVQVATKGLFVRTASGDIEALRGGTSADLDTASGELNAKGFTGPVKASTLSGDLTLEDLEGDIQAAALSGDLKATNVAPTDKSRFTVVSGSVSLRLRGGAASYAVRAETVSGDIEVGGVSAENELSAGSGPSVIVKSVSGDVRVR